ncbi:hypothetical protein GH714_039563 [Hevea brasiliensis]|uniref:Peptidase A1 domain-containing protein n=1 Tax=Hevea brasiliensis TaxID=3981 RepID=A0A6A6KG68_HEVBR|nr:hypothetical protein GH714_039563 [Hevea brasiliensis]
MNRESNQFNLSCGVAENVKVTDSAATLPAKDGKKHWCSQLYRDCRTWYTKKGPFPHLRHWKRPHMDTIDTYFKPSDVFHNFYFGCGQNNQGLFRGSAGLLGLGRDPLSLVSQTAGKYNKIFSYCLPSSASSTGFLTFGGSPSKSAKFTPLTTISDGTSFYGLDFTGISVGGRKLSISQSVFSDAGAIIDSGTVITRLPPAAYSALRSAFRKMMTKYPRAPALSILDTATILATTVRLVRQRLAFLQWRS